MHIPFEYRTEASLEPTQAVNAIVDSTIIHLRSPRMVKFRASLDYIRKNEQSFSSWSGRAQSTLTALVTTLQDFSFRVVHPHTPTAPIKEKPPKLLERQSIARESAWHKRYRSNHCPRCKVQRSRIFSSSVRRKTELNGQQHVPFKKVAVLPTLAQHSCRICGTPTSQPIVSTSSVAANMKANCQRTVEAAEGTYAREMRAACGKRGKRRRGGEISLVHPHTGYLLLSFSALVPISRGLKMAL
jgi:hypothetical protein